jgi:hypothetical protein
MSSSCIFCSPLKAPRSYFLYEQIIKKNKINKPIKNVSKQELINEPRISEPFYNGSFTQYLPS